MPGYAHDLGHGAADIAYSMLLAADAAGALAAGFVLESRSLLQARPKTAFLLAMLWCCAIAGFATAVPPLSHPTLPHELHACGGVLFQVPRSRLADTRFLDVFHQA